MLFDDRQRVNSWALLLNRMGAPARLFDIKSFKTVIYGQYLWCAREKESSESGNAIGRSCWVPQYVNIEVVPVRWRRPSVLRTPAQGSDPAVVLCGEDHQCPHLHVSCLQ
jgi:hypothetical protein